MTNFILSNSSHSFNSTIQPIYDAEFHFWRCQNDKGEDFNIVDMNGTEFTVSGNNYSNLTPMQFYLAFTPNERIAIKSSTDPLVKEFWATYELAVSTNSSINPNLNSVQSGLTYLATPTPTGPGILASSSRIAEISNGVAQ